MTAPAAEELRRLLAAGERAVFHGPPLSGVQPLRRAAELATELRRDGQRAAAEWLLAVGLTAAGRYGPALPLLDRLTHHRSARGQAALAAASAASLHRQLGRHAAARVLDRAGLAVADGQPDAIFDCRVGLAADAVGLGEADVAADEAAAAARVVVDRAGGWRQRVRLGWLRAELALLTDRPAQAVDAAAAAVTEAELAGAPRHVAKSLLFRGVAEQLAGTGAPVATLRRAAELAETLAARPLVWPARAVLAGLLAPTDPAEADRCRSVAGATVRDIAADLPDRLRADWFGRPEVAGLPVR